MVPIIKCEGLEKKTSQLLMIRKVEKKIEIKCN
jgi:hypothetical protein